MAGFFFRTMQPRTALVTGGNRGIGLEVCKQLARHGCGVLMGTRSLFRSKTAVDTLKAEGLDVTAIELDITRADHIAEAAARIQKRFGGLDILVNNAAVLLSENTPLLELTAEELRSTLGTNLMAQIAMCQAFVPGMMTQRYGRVVNVSSQSGQLKGMGTYAPAYAISKAALNAVTRILAETTRDSGVLVNSVNPGWVRTDMGGPHAPRSVHQGAETIVWAALLPRDGPTGGFFTDKREMDW